MTTETLVSALPFRSIDADVTSPTATRRADQLTVAMLCACSIFALAVPSMSAAQTQTPDIAAPAGPAPVDTDAPMPSNSDEVGFAADSVQYDDNADIVTATGNVQMQRDGNHLRADKVVWNRKSGRVQASGNVIVVDPEGNRAYGDQTDLTDTLKDGIVENLLVVMQRQQRIVAARGTLSNGIYTLDHAAYTPCAVETSENCPKSPTWQIKAVKVTYDPERKRIKYHKARLEMLGVPLLALPYFTHSVDSAKSGLLSPQLRVATQNGVELALPYYYRIGPNRDFTVTPYFFSEQLPMLSATYRSFTHNGAYRLTGFLTRSKRTTNQSRAILLPTGKQIAYQQRDWRGYVDASGNLQLDPNWSISGSIRRTSDRTFLRRYNILWDDHLRSTLQAERVGAKSYFSLSGWSVQTMRTTENQGLQPVALPVLDYRLRLRDPLFGGRFQFQANTLALSRSAGQDTQRAFISAEWSARTLTGLGQEISFTAYGRGDLYHSSRNRLNPLVNNRGKTGWQKRGIIAGAVDMKWPFIGNAFGGTQRVTPRLQIVGAPRLANLIVPNEDSLSVELEDSNLFALNRFPGYDRFEDSVRLTYGLDYNLTLPSFTLHSVIGQSYRLNRRPTILPNGTGLASRSSDVVGRTTLRYKDFVSITHRYRLDKDNLAIRRNEIDATIGSYKTYMTLGYQRLNRDISTALATLTDHEEVRIGARVQLAKFWSVFGSTVVDMTNVHEELSSTYDGFEPVRQRLGVEYQDDCLRVSAVWKRSYVTVGDAKANNSVSLQVAFRNLGL